MRVVKNSTLETLNTAPNYPYKQPLYSQLNSEIELYFKMVGAESSNVPTELVQSQALACIFSYGALQEEHIEDEWIKKNYAYFMILLEIVKIMEQHDNLH